MSVSLGGSCYIVYVPLMSTTQTLSSCLPTVPAMISLFEIDTNYLPDPVEIFHQPGMRYVSLRFLSNYVLKRDMQQDVHDSVEDAMAAFELYEQALQWKAEGIFEKKLQEIYAFGMKTEWKIVVDRQ